ncbi:hypothetical protein V8E36_007106 [Tilletia maclaganii]
MAATTSKKTTASQDGSQQLMAQVQTLQHSLATSTDLNPLTDLIDLATTLASGSSTNSKKALDRALLVLGQALASLISSSSSKKKKQQRTVLLYPDQVDSDGNLTSASLPKSLAAKLSKAELQVSEWLKQQWNNAVHLLCAFTAHADEGIRTTALRQLIALQLAASNALSTHAATASEGKGEDDNEDADALGTARWAPSPWRATVLALAAGPPTTFEPSSSPSALRRHAHVHADLHGTFLDELAEKYDDARFAFLRELKAILSNPPTSATASHASLRSNALQLLIFLTAIPTEEEHLNAFFVPALGSAGKLSKKKAKKTKAVGTDGKAKGKADDMDGSGDEEGGPQGGDDMQDWFSDSDDERLGSNSAPIASHSKTAGLGKAAREQRAKRKRKSAVPLSEAIHSLAAQKAAFANAWLALMLPRSAPVGKAAKGVNASALATQPIGGTLSVAQTHQILLVLHSQILPHFTRPNLVHEFLVDCLNQGQTDVRRFQLGARAGGLEAVSEASGANAATALLALHGLYILIIQHNLDYPDFFERLYTLLLLTPHLLHMRYRSRFLRLLETFLGSSLLPASIVASFAKRLSRLALRASPAAAVCVVPLVWNLLKRHKNCMALIHREFDGDRLALGPAGIEDPFDPLESDPLNTRALESSLWELAALGAYQAALQRQGTTSTGNGGEAHYLHSTSTLSRILADPFLKERYNLDDFLDVTYGTLFENETARILADANANSVGEEEEGRRRKKPIPTPVVRASLGDVQLERYERERAMVKEREERLRSQGAADAESEANDGTAVETLPAEQAGAIAHTMRFRGFSTAQVRAKKRKLAAASNGSGPGAVGEADDVMDLWQF